MRVALIQDWLNGMRGGEKVLEVFCELLPDAEIFTLLYEPSRISDTINSHKVHESFIGKLPMAKKHYRNYLPLFPSAIETFNLQEFDVVISISHCVAKGVITSPNSINICYCLTPMRYIWDLYDQYFNPKTTNVVKRFIISIIAHYLRIWDVNSSSRVDEFYAISDNIKNKIKRYYNRESEVIYPPVDCDYFKPSDKKETDDEYYLVVSAFVPYKRIDLAVNAFNKLGKKLIIVGKGPEGNSLKEIAHSNIEFTDWADDEMLLKLYQNCKALIFPSEEDFGIVPLEAQSCGKPVIAYGKGGALETIVKDKTGIFFKKQNTNSLIEAVERFESMTFDPKIIRQNAEKFDRKIFKEKIRKLISDKCSNIN